jgi:hypothetical protein
MPNRHGNSRFTTVRGDLSSRQRAPEIVRGGIESLANLVFAFCAARTFAARRASTYPAPARDMVTSPADKSYARAKPSRPNAEKLRA